MDDASNAKPFAGIILMVSKRKWGNGYAWSVTFHKVSNKLALDAPLHSLLFHISTGGKQYIVKNTFADGIVCDRCYYVDNLSMDQFIG